MCLVAEAAGQGVAVPRGGQEVQRAVRAGPPGYQQLQLQIYGGEHSIPWFIVADQNLGSGAFFSPGSEIGFFPVSGSRISDPQPFH